MDTLFALPAGLLANSVASLNFILNGFVCWYLLQILSKPSERRVAYWEEMPFAVWQSGNNKSSYLRDPK